MSIGLVYLWSPNTLQISSIPSRHLFHTLLWCYNPCYVLSSSKRFLQSCISGVILLHLWIPFGIKSSIPSSYYFLGLSIIFPSLYLFFIYIPHCPFVHYKHAFENKQHVLLFILVCQFTFSLNNKHISLEQLVFRQICLDFFKGAISRWYKWDICIFLYFHCLFVVLVAYHILKTKFIFLSQHYSYFLLNHSFNKIINSVLLFHTLQDDTIIIIILLLYLKKRSFCLLNVIKTSI